MNDVKKILVLALAVIGAIAVVAVLGMWLMHGAMMGGMTGAGVWLLGGFLSAAIVAAVVLLLVPKSRP